MKALAGAVRPGGGVVIDFAAAAESILPSFSDEPRTMQGFGEIALFADPDGTPFTLGAGRLLLTAVR